MKTSRGTKSSLRPIRKTKPHRRGFLSRPAILLRLRGRAALAARPGILPVTPGPRYCNLRRHRPHSVYTGDGGAPHRVGDSRFPQRGGPYDANGNLYLARHHQLTGVREDIEERPKYQPSRHGH